MSQSMDLDELGPSPPQQELPTVEHITAALEQLQPGLSGRIARYGLHSLLDAGLMDIEDIQIASRESLIAGGVHPIATDHILAAQGKRQGTQYKCSHLAEGDDNFSERTVRIVTVEGASVGTGSCIAQDEVATNYHVVFKEDVPSVDENGAKVLVDVAIPVTAKGLQLVLIRHHKSLDIAIFKCQGIICSSPFVLSSTASLYLGMKIACLAFPKMRDEEFFPQGPDKDPAKMRDEEFFPQGPDKDPANILFDPAAAPYLTFGRVSCMDTPHVASGTYSGWPNSSGGSVISNSKTLIGMHCRAIFHEGPPAKLNANQSSALSKPSRKGAQLSYSITALAKSLVVTNENVQQKNSGSVFVTAEAIKIVRGIVSGDVTASAHRRSMEDPLAKCMKEQSSVEAGVDERHVDDNDCCICRCM